MRNQFGGLRPSQKQRLTAELQAVFHHDGLPEPTRHGESELDRLRTSIHCDAKGEPRVKGNRLDCGTFAAARRSADDPFTR